MNNIQQYTIEPVNEEELYREIRQSRSIGKKILLLIAKTITVILIPITGVLTFAFHFIGIAVKFVLYFFSILGGVGGAISFFEYLSTKQHGGTVLFGFILGFVCFILALSVDLIGEALIKLIGKMIDFLYY